MSLANLQVDVANRITAMPFFASATPPIQAVVELLGDIGSRIENAMEKLGIGIVVLTPGGRWAGDDADGLEFEPAIVIEISEVPTTNETGRRALDCVQAIIVELHGRTHSTGNGAAATRRLVSSNPPFTLVNTPGEVDPAITYQVYFTTQLTLEAPSPSATYVAGEDGVIVTGEDGSMVAGDPETE